MYLRKMTANAKPARTLAAWLQRCARVRSRVGQIWVRSDENKDMVLVIGDPVLTDERDNSWSGTAVNVIDALMRNGWCHEVFSLERGTRFFLNETWFSNSEAGDSSVFGRVE